MLLLARLCGKVVEIEILVIKLSVRCNKDFSIIILTL